MPRESTTVTVKGRLLDETAKALQIYQKEGILKEPVTAWVPLSQCDHVSKGAKTPEGREVTVIMYEWIAKEKMLDYEAD